MKKYLKVVLAVTFVFLFAVTLTGCGNTENSKENSGGVTAGGGKEKSFPTANFIPSYAKYEGSGKIVVATKNESSTPKNAVIYIDNATLEDVLSYVNVLKSNGLKNANLVKEEQTGFNEWGTYSWVGVTSDNSFSVSITLNEEDDSTKDIDGNTVNYNLSLSLSDSNPYE